MWQVLHVVADPRRQRAVLVILVHRRKVPPLRITAEQLHQTRLEVNPKPFPLKQKVAGARGRTVGSQPGPKTGGRQKEREESGFEQHSIGLIAGENLRGGDEGKKAEEANEEAESGPGVHKSRNGGGQADPAEGHERRVAGADPIEGGRIPEARSSER